MSLRNPSRRGFLRTTAGAAAGAALPSSVRAAAARGDRPNFLWVVTEDNTFSYDGPYGDPCAHTPHVSRLAKDGIVYENSHSNAPVCAPSRSTIITGMYASSLGTQHMRSFRPLPEGVRFFPEFFREAGYFCTNHAKTDYNTSTPFRQAWDLCNDQAHWRRRQPGQPFFAVFNYMESHESQLFERKPLLTDPAKVKVPPYLPDTAETRADQAQYFDCVGRADAALGKVLDQLEADGLAEDTIVFYYADHGGCLPRSKRFLYDNGTHTPMVVRFPKKWQHLAPAAPGSRSGELLSYVDLAPTLLSLAGIPAPSYFQGRAFAGPDRKPAPEFLHAFRGRMDERSDFTCAVTDGRYRYVRNFMPYRPAGQRIAYLWREASMRRYDELYRLGGLPRVQRAFFEPRAAEELFDCTTDPHNVANLAGDPAHRQALERLRAANRTHMIGARDTGFLPEAMMIAKSRGASPTTVTRDDSAYPVARLRDLADELQLSGNTDAAIAAMQAPQSVVRYWAVAGMLTSTHPKVRDAIARLLEDPDPSVGVVAAEATLRGGPNARAWERLHEGLLPHQSLELALSALNALRYLPAGPQPLRERVRAIAADTGEESPWGTEQYGPHAAQDLVARGLA